MAMSSIHSLGLNGGQERPAVRSHGPEQGKSRSHKMESYSQGIRISQVRISSSPFSSAIEIILGKSSLTEELGRSLWTASTFLYRLHNNNRPSIGRDERFEFIHTLTGLFDLFFYPDNYRKLLICSKSLLSIEIRGRWSSIEIQESQWVSSKSIILDDLFSDIMKRNRSRKYEKIGLPTSSHSNQCPWIYSARVPRISK